MIRIYLVHKQRLFSFWNDFGWSTTLNVSRFYWKSLLEPKVKKIVFCLENSEIYNLWISNVFLMFCVSSNGRFFVGKRRFIEVKWKQIQRKIKHQNAGLSLSSTNRAIQCNQAKKKTMTFKLHALYLWSKLREFTDPSRVYNFYWSFYSLTIIRLATEIPLVKAAFKTEQKSPTDYQHVMITRPAT